MGNSCSSSLVSKQSHLVYVPTVPLETISTSEPECSICLEKFGNKKFCELQCSHKFCEKCIEPWLERSTTCPNCRKAIDCFDTIKSLRGELLCMSMMIDTILNGEEHETMKGVLWMAYDINDPESLNRRFHSSDIIKALLFNDDNGDNNELLRLKIEVATYKTAIYLIAIKGQAEMDVLIAKTHTMLKETPLLAILSMSILTDYVDVDFSRFIQYFFKVGNQPKYLNDPAFQKIKSDVEMKVFLQAIKANKKKLKSIGEDEEKFMEELRNL